MIKLPNSLKEDEVLSQVDREVSSSRDATTAKRNLFKERESLYMNVSDQERKVYVRLIYDTEQTLLALQHKNKPIVDFMGRKWGDSEQAKNINNLKDFDYDEDMNLAPKKYQTYHDKFHYGAGIEVFTGWNKVSKAPTSIVIDPRSRDPDTNFTVDTGFRFHGFDRFFTKPEMNPKYGFFNIYNIKSDDLVQAERFIEERIAEGMSNDMALNDMKSKAPRLLTAMTTGDSTGIYSIRIQYTRINGVPYVVHLANGGSLIIKLEEIKPVFSEEKEDKDFIKFPVIVRHRSPLRGDPYGVSVPDLLEDKQRMMQLFLYLEQVKAQNAAWGDAFFYDPDVIENIDDIKIPTIGRKLIPAKLKINPNPILAMPDKQQSGASYDIIGTLRQFAARDTTMDDGNLGTNAESDTLGVNDRIQKNANIRLLLGAKIDERAEKDFRKTWYRSYMEFFNPMDEKNIFLNTGVGKQPYTVKKKDITTVGDINITIKSVSEIEESRERNLSVIMPFFGTMYENAGSDFGRKSLLRQGAEWMGLSGEFANLIFDSTPEERQARLDLELLNANESPGPIQDMAEDHATFIAIYQQAYDTPAKYKAIRAREMARTMQDKLKVTTDPGIDPATQSQLTSNGISQMNKKENGAASLQDISK